MPDPRSAKEEAEIAVRTSKTMEIVKQYRRDHCDEEGRPVRAVIQPELQRGIKKLQRRVKEGEIVVRTTDKSKKLCISSYESYTRQGRVHVGEDREVSEEEIRNIQKKVNTTSRALVKIFRVGEGRGGNNAERTTGAYSNNSCTIPPLTINPKDHKKGESNGDPKSRPAAPKTAD